MTNEGEREDPAGDWGLTGTPVKVTPAIRDRVKEMVRVKARDLVPNPHNFRTHPEAQRAALVAMLGDVGYADPIIGRRLEDGRIQIIDGHLRAETTPDLEVPVVVLDVTEQEANKILATLDPMAAMAGTDVDKLKDLLAECKFEDEAVEEMISKMTGVQLDLEDPDAMEKDQIFELREDTIFTSSTRWGIPDLRVDMLADVVPHKLWIGEKIPGGHDKLFIHSSGVFSRQLCEGGTLAFYVEDYNFESCWIDAVVFVQRLRKMGWAAVASPDFSLWRDDPPCAQMWNIYRARWCARYWQEAGIKVIPSLNWSDEASHEFAFDGLPEKPPVVMVQCRTTQTTGGKQRFIQGIGTAIERLRPRTVVVYGGNDNRAWLALPRGPEYVNLGSWMSERAPGLKAREKGIA